MRLLRRRHAEEKVAIGDGLCLRGPLWVGDGTEHADGRVVVDSTGAVTAVGAAADVGAGGVPEVAAGWIGPGLVDHHVHLAFADPAYVVRHGVVEVRDLGAPPADAQRYRALVAPRVRIAGPLLTAPGGYPSRSWGSAGFAAFVDDPDQAAGLVAGLAGQVDVVKVALEPRAGPVPTRDVLDAVVRAAHERGREVTCHALTVAMVERALAAGVDELAHTPTDAVPDELVSRIAAAGVRVVSTLRTFLHGGEGRVAVGNARRLVAAGVDVRYGTDLGNAGTRPGADPAELRLLADEVGLGPEGALRAATKPIRVGEPAGLVALTADPRNRPEHWREPQVVVVGTTVHARPLSR